MGRLDPNVSHHMRASVLIALALSSCSVEIAPGLRLDVGADVSFKSTPVRGGVISSRHLPLVASAVPCCGAT